MSEDLRGSTPIYTAKDVLISLDRKVGDMDSKIDGMKTDVAIVLSQDLNTRVLALEQKWQQLQGAGTVLRFLVGTSVLAAVTSMLAVLKAFGAI